eukprot:gnl/MRDRNA2_/MRDRNA2_34784_c0_seq1.p1 gnl/MRDRNA2_/MRDRNA2_34784_c0~~gnl/MRDRNA2_/MRDRNA2_34784_c0_seq1.p1  ORF type:complete len:472 (+),score=79.74 gnl/MRDRNA2_/MRDRNA2_34784_c0_seq1:115-1530(+)
MIFNPHLFEYFPQSKRKQVMRSIIVVNLLFGSGFAANDTAGSASSSFRVVNKLISRAFGAWPSDQAHVEKTMLRKPAQLSSAVKGSKFTVGPVGVPHTSRRGLPIHRIHHRWQEYSLQHRRSDKMDRVRPAYAALPVGEADDEEVEESLGIPEVRWAPVIDPMSEDVEPKNGSTVMPLFPVGMSYPLYSTPVLIIFEPRYRAMYNDILFSGARRFMVCNVESGTGRLAEVGAVFYLDELKEVSEQTQDRVKFVGQHRVIGRVKLLKVLNQKASSTRETYLRGEVEYLEDRDEDTANSEAEVSQLWKDLIDVQAQLGQEPRFTDSAKSNATFTRGTSMDDKGLWGTIALWQDFLKQRAVVLNQKMQQKIQQEITTFLKSNKDQISMDKVNDRGELSIRDLPDPLAKEIKAIQRRFKDEFEAMVSDPNGLQFQVLLQSGSHAERLSVFRSILSKERQRLAAMATLKSMFKEPE